MRCLRAVSAPDSPDMLGRFCQPEYRHVAVDRLVVPSLHDLERASVPDEHQSAPVHEELTCADHISERFADAVLQALDAALWENGAEGRRVVWGRAAT
jgi:hypothetical protein